MKFEPILKFLADLSKHNNREWFEKNKGRYLEAKDEFGVFITGLLNEALKFDNSLSGLDPKKIAFRIYRDVRFSKDKRPYKTNMGAAFSAVGKGLGLPGYYLHIEPGNKSFVAGGLFMPEPANLAKVRQEIDYNASQLVKIFSDKKFSHTFGKFWDEDKLKRAPKGFEETHKHIEWLKLKSFIVNHKFKDAEVKNAKFLTAVVQSFKMLKPLNTYLTEALA